MPAKNDVICFSTGVYSDYSLMGHFKVLEYFNMKELGNEFVNSDRGTHEITHYWDTSKRPLERLETPVVKIEPVPVSSDGFQAFLIRKGLVTPFDVSEYHLGDYDFKVPDYE